MVALAQPRQAPRHQVPRLALRLLQAPRVSGWTCRRSFRLVSAACFLSALSLSLEKICFLTVACVSKNKCDANSGWRDFRRFVLKWNIDCRVCSLHSFVFLGGLFSNTQNKGFGFTSGLGTGTAAGTTGFGTALGATSLGGFGGFNLQSTQQQQGEC